MVAARCWLSSQTGGPGGTAISCIELAGDLCSVFAELGIAGVPTGAVRLRRVPLDQAGSTDEAVVARWSAERATVMAHGGSAVVAGLLGRCRAAGLCVVNAAGVEPRAAYPEAFDELEARMLDVLSRCVSPAGIESLLDQPRRWRMAGLDGGPLADGRGLDRDRMLRRLIEPALVVAVGPPNVGKSSLLNALAGRGVSVVADAPGTTRDHVGALIDLARVVVRWVDTPGIGTTAGDGATDAVEADRHIQHEAQRIALEVAFSADVLVVCGDATGVIEPPPTRGTVVRVGLRADLGPVSGSVGSGREVDARVSVRNGTGLERLVEVVREAVVPRREIESPEPWVFWKGGPG
ncbi:MAG: 50S ribosome-binding GTPase [Phycisphaerales bacterium]|nr:50S ribosome-binding GTPase [Phycisphaerales bacterium]